MAGLEGDLGFGLIVGAAPCSFKLPQCKIRAMATRLQPSVPVPADLPQQVARALAEDIGAGDLTAALIPADRTGRATVITREAAVICGMPYVNATFDAIEPQVRIDWQVAEGERVKANQPLFNVEGPARALLTGERTALNFLQLLSGTATAANAYAVLLEGTKCRLLDTRKTIPGLRTAQKYAVRVGGGQNHRMGLFDGVLIKENHIMAAGSIAKAVAEARRSGGQVPVEVEVETLSELQQAIAAGADIAMLDEFSLQSMREAVAVNSAAMRPLKLEASGGISSSTIRDIAETGVDYISVGSITKHVHAIDLSMRFEWPTPTA
jgi:nicotinate-nucleotide pyrophosphorylase (carboxylating)